MAVSILLGSYIEKLYLSITRFLEIRKYSCPMTKAKFTEDYGRGSVNMVATGNTEETSKNVILIAVTESLTGRDKYISIFNSMHDKLTVADRGFTIETLLITDTDKPSKSFDAFAQYKVIENVKTVSQMLCNPIDHQCASPVEIVTSAPHDDMPMLRSADPVVFWLGASPGNIIKETRWHANTGIQLIYYRVKK